jgi:outer membrane protein assembly factor BamB
MHGEVIHAWTAPFSRVWPKPPHVREPVADGKIYIFACHLYPNGDLLAVFHGTGDTPYGYGLAKLDKDSHVLWTYSANVHHAVDVSEDGTIYVLTQRIVHDMPKGLEFFPTPALVDDLVLLSPEGEELRTIPLLEALRDSPFGLLLPLRAPTGLTSWDVLHANAVEVLSPAMATHFPLFKAGQVLVSLRELDTLAVVSPETGSAVWAARGPWRGQHDPHFLDNGRLLVFDNRGSAQQSRVFEYDPQTQSCPWSYASESSPSFLTPIQGRCQRLANGNTLIVNSKDGVLLEVTPDKELVWSRCCHAHVPWARRYAPDELTFLKGTHNAR